MPVTINGSGSTGSINTAVLPSSGTFATQSYADTAGGLVKIATETFSAVSSVSVNNCFSSSYLNYRIVMNVIGTVNDREGIKIRFRSGGVDNSAASYGRTMVYATSTTGAISASSQTASFFGPTSTQESSVSMDVYKPFDAAFTTTTGISVYTANTEVDLSMGNFASANSFDGFSAIVSSGTITGTIRVYGYRN